MVCKAEKTVSRTIAAPVIQAKNFVKSANQVSVNSDETGCKEKGKSMRSKAILKNQLFPHYYLKILLAVTTQHSLLLPKFSWTVTTISEIANFVEENNELGEAVLAHVNGDMSEALRVLEECYHGEYDSRPWKTPYTANDGNGSSRMIFLKLNAQPVKTALIISPVFPSK